MGRDPVVAVLRLRTGSRGSRVSRISFGVKKQVHYDYRCRVPDSRSTRVMLEPRPLHRVLFAGRQHGACAEHI